MSAVAPAAPRQRHWPSVLQFALSLLAVLGLSGLALLATLGALFGLLFQNLSIPEATNSLTTGFALLAASSILLLSALHAYPKMNGQPLHWPWLERLLSTLQKRRGLLLAVSLVLGGLASQREILALFAMPILHSLAVLLISFVILKLATRGLVAFSRQRALGVFTSGMLIAPLIVIVIELFVALLGLLIMVAYLASQDQYQGLLQQLSNLNALNLSQPDFLELISPLASDPVIFTLILLYIALFVPVLEELLKPVGLYLSLNRERDGSPASGFALGALSGAGFALFENLLLGVASEEWLAVLLARIGTTGMHVLASGIVGWSLVSGRHKKRWWLAPAGFLLSILLHGLWNGLTIAASFSALANQAGSGLSFSPASVTAFLIGLLILGLGSLLVLRLSRKRFQLDAQNIN